MVTSSPLGSWLEEVADSLLLEARSEERDGMLVTGVSRLVM